MNAKVKQLWLEALRSGEFRQGKELLHPTSETYCCLGVLCEIYQQETGNGSWVDQRFKVAAFDVEIVELPSAVAQWAGLNSSDPVLGNRSNSVTASVLNDRGKTFEYIANRIEKYL